jgi:putative tryptophan/tyrosine transport system substrate-binding protein
MRRREFIAALGSAAAWPAVGRAQQPTLPTIGFLNSGSAASFAVFAARFRDGLNETGYVEGRNVAIEYRWADGHYDRLAALAADLVRRGVDVIAATGNSFPGLAAKAATSTIPIVFLVGIDPVMSGLVASLNRPGGNTTGVDLMTDTVTTKRLGLLRELVPASTSIGVLMNPNADSPTTRIELTRVQEAARAWGRQSVVLPVSNERDIDTAFVTVVQQRIDALFVISDGFFTDKREKFVSLALLHKVPAIWVLA